MSETENRLRSEVRRLKKDLKEANKKINELEKHIEKIQKEESLRKLIKEREDEIKLCRSLGYNYGELPTLHFHSVYPVKLTSATSYLILSS